MRLDLRSVRRWPFAITVTLIALTSALVAALTGGILYHLLGDAAHVSGFTALRYTAVLWLTLTLAGTAVAVLATTRPGWKVGTVTVLATVAVLCAGVPGATWWTYAVDHSPRGAAYPETAVADFMAYGPLGNQWSRNNQTWSRLVCPDRAAQLRRDVDQVATHLTQYLTGKDTTFKEALLLPGAHADRTDDQATVTAPVAIDMTYPARGREMGWRVTVGEWRFSLVKDDGWVVCGVSHPDVREELP